MEPSELVIWATKPKGKPALMLAQQGIKVLPAEEEGNLDHYLLSKRVAVERRTGSNLLKGIRDKTLFTSALHLRERFALPVLVVEGEVDYTYTRFDPQAVRGALSSMILSYGVHLLYSPTVEETAALLAMMARQEQAGIPEISLIPKRKATDLADMQRRIVEMLPGCGLTAARELLQHFGSVKRVVNAKEDQLSRVRGIGARKRAEIVRVLNAEYESVDTERNLEDAIEAAPELLFGQPVKLVARQHRIPTEGALNIVDLVFLDPKARELVVVEAKRGRISGDHYRQLRRYLDSARESRLLRRFLEGGASIRGVLATVEESGFRPRSRAVSICVVDRQRVIEVLKRLRDRRAGRRRARRRE